MRRNEERSNRAERSRAKNAQQRCHSNGLCVSASERSGTGGVQCSDGVHDTVWVGCAVLLFSCVVKCVTSVSTGPHVPCLMRILTGKGACGTGPATCVCVCVYYGRQKREVERDEESDGGRAREKGVKKERMLGCDRSCE